MNAPTLEAANISVSYRVEKRWVAALRDFNLSLKPGEIVGLVGESGSGKSTAALALMRCLPANARFENGAKLRLNGGDYLECGAAEMRGIWARQFKLVPQNAGAALNPAMRIGAQLLEAVHAATELRGAEADQAINRICQDVQLVDADSVLRRYPHELSGGMQQRIMIAMALITEPQLLILDEPTTGLDVTTEAVILDLIRGLIAERDTAVIYITHNLGVVAQLCQRALVLYAGETMEDSPVADLFSSPRHPYSLSLLRSLPKPGQDKHAAPLYSIPGNPPALDKRLNACAFADRCDWAIDLCHSTKPILEAAGVDRRTRCHRWRDLEEDPKPAPKEGDSPSSPYSANAEAGAGLGVILRTTHLQKHFRAPRTWREWLRRDKAKPIRAVDGVDLQLHAGQTLGLVGESGSGKTTLARVIIGLEERTGGDMALLGMDIRGGLRGRRPELLSRLSLIFQNPQNALNPYMTVGQAIRRPLMKLRRFSRVEADAETLRLLRDVNLPADYAKRFPDALSGGEKQRVVIARAFASEPDLILCDEPVSALDVSVQAAVLNLLSRLQAEKGAAYLFISHDLAAVGYLADSIAVMYLGQIVEIGNASDIFQPPFQPYTEALFSAIPSADPAHQPERILLREGLPSARDLPSGCRFHTRCPRKIGAICEAEAPPWRETDNGHAIRCHIPLDDLLSLQAERAGD